jgi:hypothetical protein
MQNLVSEPSIGKRHLQRNCGFVTRILRAVAVTRYIGCVRSHDQAVLATLDPGFVCSVG